MFSDSHKSIPWWGWVKIAALGAALLAILKSGIWPSEDDSKTWYDRAIRIVGSILIFIVVGAGAYLLLRDGR